MACSIPDEIPDWLAGYFGRRYEKLFTGPDGRRRANTFLRQTIEGMYCHVYAKWLLIISWPLMQ